MLREGENRLKCEGRAAYDENTSCLYFESGAAQEHQDLKLFQNVPGQDKEHLLMEAVELILGLIKYITTLYQVK